MRIEQKLAGGFTLVEIMIVVALIGLLATIATPTWVRARTNSQMTTCINNLRQIEAAKQQWAIETKQATNATPGYTDISPFLKNSVSCPSAGTITTFSGTYDPLDVSTPAVCRISPATHAIPPQNTN